MPHIVIRSTGELFWLHFDPHIINSLITTATKGEMFISAFQEKNPSPLLLIWLIRSAMSANE